MSKSAIETMKDELIKIQESMSECISDFGFVKNEHKYRYQILVQKARSFKEAIDWMDRMYNDPHQVDSRRSARTSPCWTCPDGGSLMMDEYDIVKDK